MDPATILAITGACVGITRNATSFITGLNDLIVRLRDVELDLSAIEAQTGILSLVSERLRLWITTHQNELTQVERTRLWECVNSCEQLVRALQTATNRAGVGRDLGTSEQRRALGLWKRFQALLAQPQLQRYARTLEQQGNALNVFLNVFQSTRPRQRPAALQGKRNSAIIDEAISSATETTSRVLAWLQKADNEDAISESDLGFGETSSTASSSRSSGSSQVLHSTHYDIDAMPSEGGLTLQNLSIHNEKTHGHGRRAGHIEIPRPSILDPRRFNGVQPAPPPSMRSGILDILLRPGRHRHQHDRRAGHSMSPTASISQSWQRGAGHEDAQHHFPPLDNLNLYVQPVVGAGAPGGGDSPPPSDSDDNESVTTVTGTPSRSLPSSSGDFSPTPSNSSRSQHSAHSIRDELRRLSVASSSSAFRAVQEEADPVVENIRNDLVRLQEIMLELRRSNSAIAPELERQIEELFDQVRNNLRLVGNPDERILRGSDIQSRNSSGETALHIAARKRPVDLVSIRKFLNLGASVQDKDDHLNTPLLSLVSTEYTPCDEFLSAVSLFLDRGSDINERTSDGWTALNRVIQVVDIATIKLLINRGANVNTPTLDLMTPLHRAIQSTSTSIIKLLLSHSANPNAVSRSGETPLSVLCRTQWYSNTRAQSTMVDLLLTAGAMPTAGPPGANRPLDIVIRAVHERERRLKYHQWATDDIGSFIWIRNDFEAHIHTLHVLFRYSTTITLHYSTRSLARGMFLFKGFENVEGTITENLRARFRKRVAEIVVLGDIELCDEVRRFYNLPVTR